MLGITAGGKTHKAVEAEGAPSSRQLPAGAPESARSRRSSAPTRGSRPGGSSVLRQGVLVRCWCLPRAAADVLPSGAEPQRGRACRYLLGAPGRQPSQTHGLWLSLSRRLHPALSPHALRQGRLSARIVVSKQDTGCEVDGENEGEDDSCSDEGWLFFNKTLFC